MSEYDILLTVDTDSLVEEAYRLDQFAGTVRAGGFGGVGRGGEAVSGRGSGQRQGIGEVNLGYRRQQPYRYRASAVAATLRHLRSVGAPDS